MIQRYTVKDARNRFHPPMTQEELAAEAQIDQTYVSVIEAGKQIPSDEIKMRLAKALGLRPVQLRFAKAQPDKVTPDTVAY